MIQDQLTIGWGERFLERYGWPALFLVVVLLAIYAGVKATWPLLRAYVQNLQKAVEDAHALIRVQLEVANTRADGAHREFLTTLEEQRRSHEAVMKSQAEAHSQAIQYQSRMHSDALGEQIGILKEMRSSMQEIRMSIDEVKTRNGGGSR